MTAKRSINTKVSCKRVAKNPHMYTGDTKWPHDNWYCTLTRKGRRIATYFSKGMGHKGAAPTSGEIIESLAMDAAGFENARDFNDWAADYGYALHVPHLRRAAQKTYRQTGVEAKKLRKFLGDELYERVVYGKR